MTKYTDQEKKELTAAQTKLETYIQTLKQTHQTYKATNIEEKEYTQRVAKIHEQYKTMKEGLGKKAAQDVLSSFNRICANVNILIQEISGTPTHGRGMFDHETQSQKEIG